jgi:hypothetical protein
MSCSLVDHAGLSVRDELRKVGTAAGYVGKGGMQMGYGVLECSIRARTGRKSGDETQTSQPHITK